MVNIILNGLSSGSNGAIYPDKNKMADTQITLINIMLWDVFLFITILLKSNIFKY